MDVNCVHPSIDGNYVSAESRPKWASGPFCFLIEQFSDEVSMYSLKLVSSDATSNSFQLQLLESLMVCLLEMCQIDILVAVVILVIVSKGIAYHFLLCLQVLCSMSASRTAATSGSINETSRR